MKKNAKDSEIIPALNFTLQYNSDIYLYGAAAIGCILYDLLSHQGYTVSGFIDKRFYEIHSLYTLPVLPIDSGLIPKDAVIIVAVKNVYEHSRIAKILLECGFSKLIYRPYPCLLDEGNHTENQINNAYSLISGGMYIPGSPIPITFPLETETHPRNRAFLSQEGNLVTVLIPITALFTDKASSGNIQNAELPLLFLYPHIEFVKYVLGMEKASALPYLNYCENSARQINRFQITDAWRENVLQNRADVFQQMNLLFDLQYEFFIRNAPHVNWNPKRCYFNLCSGKHRTAFLAAKGKNYIPVKMDLKDYTQWLRVQKPFLEDPFRYNTAIGDSQFCFQLIRQIMSFLGRNHYHDAPSNPLSMLSFRFHMNDDGFFRDFFKRCGCTIFSSIEGDSSSVPSDYAIVDETLSAAYCSSPCRLAYCCFIIKVSDFLLQDDSAFFSGIYQGRKVIVEIEKSN